MNRYNGLRVLVTGHRGFKGSWLSLWLKELGAQVYGVSLPTGPSLFRNYDFLDSDVRLDLAGSYCNVEYLVKSVQPDIVMHLAAQPLVNVSYSNPGYTLRNNICATVNLLEALNYSNAKPCATVVVTSDKCYENDNSGRRLVEGDRLGGHDPYSTSKACQELISQSYSRIATQNRIVTARGGNVVGGGDFSNGRLLVDITEACRKGHPVEIRNPASTRPFQYVLDCLSGYMKLGLATYEGTASGAYNFGPEESLTVGEVARIAVEEWRSLRGTAIPIELGASTMVESQALQLDSSKARQELGWISKVSPEEAVRRAVKWYATAPYTSLLEYSKSEIQNYSAL